MKNISSVHVMLLVMAVACIANCGSESEVKEQMEQKETTITIGSVTARPGESILVPISMGNSVEVAGVQLNIEFDSRLVSVDKPETAKRCPDMMIMHNVKENELLLMLYDMGGKTIPPGSGPILMLPVTLTQNATGTISLNLTKALLATQDAQTVPVSSEPGKITVRP
jgi:hypothetical protein